jgi:DNA-binding transcriptional LysR family regulator
MNADDPPPSSSSTLIQRLPRRLKMGELRAFMAVMEHRSFRKAATVLHLSQPAVTKAVASLEHTLGLRLFDRLANGVEPTLHAQGFAPHATAVFDQLRRAAQELTRLSSGASGHLRVGTVPMPAIPFLPLAVGRLIDAHPDVQVAVVEDRETELIDRLRRRDIELAILRLSLVEPGEDMQVSRLFDEKLCVVAGKSHPLAARQQLSWPELLRQRWVLPPADCYFYEFVQHSLARLDMPMPRAVVEAMSIQLQFNMALHGGLLSFGMRSQVSFAPGREFLVRLPFELPVQGAMVAAVGLKSHELSPLARQLIEAIRALTLQPPGEAADVALEALSAATEN